MDEIKIIKKNLLENKEENWLEVFFIIAIAWE
jgi:hypothetical protein